MPEQKRVFRSRHKIIGGVCGGLAEYFDVDPVLLRLAAAALLLAGAPMVVLGYILAWIIIPEAPPKVGPPGAGRPEEGSPPSDEQACDAQATVACQDRGRMVLGYALVIIGGLVLLQRAVPWQFSRLAKIGFSTFWPLVIILVGVAILARRGGKR